MKLQADAMFMMVIFFAVVVIFIFVFYVYSQLAPALQKQFNPTDNQSNIQGKIASSTNSAFINLGNILAFVFFGIGIAAIISAFFVDTSPVFFIVSMFILGIQIMIAVLLHNVFFTIVQQAVLLPIIAQFPLLATVFEYYPMFTFVMALGIVIALYMK